MRLGQIDLLPMSLDEAKDWIIERARTQEACLVVTPNIHHIRLAERDRVFADVLKRAECVVADGWPLVAVSRLTATPLPMRVAGIDLVKRVLMASDPLRIAILGGPPGAARALAEKLPEHDVVLVDPLTRGSWETDASKARLRAAVKAARPNLVIVGVGAPQQEKLAEELRPVSSGPLVCCGAAIEVLAGRRPRAPRYAQRLGLEWAYRIAMEPQRLAPRYAASAVVFMKVALRALRHTPPVSLERVSRERP